MLGLPTWGYCQNNEALVWLIISTYVTSSRSEWFQTASIISTTKILCARPESRKQIIIYRLQSERGTCWNLSIHRVFHCSVVDILSKKSEVYNTLRYHSVGLAISINTLLLLQMTLPWGLIIFPSNGFIPFHCRFLTEAGDSSLRFAELLFISRLHRSVCTYGYVVNIVLYWKSGQIPALHMCRDKSSLQFDPHELPQLLRGDVRAIIRATVAESCSPHIVEDNPNYHHPRSSFYTYCPHSY